MKKPKKKRNEQIVHMSRAGESHRGIARLFDLSRSSIDIIVHRSEKEREVRAKSVKILEEIRRLDDLDKMWPSVDLIDALRLITITRNALLKHFEGAGASEISLRDLMDHAISGMERPGYLISPLLDLKCVGKIGFWSVVNQLSNLRFGRNCDKEWKKRIAILRHCWRLIGTGPCSWSEPARR